MTLHLRPYQAQAVQDLRSALAGGLSSLLLHAPTGAGKTIIAAEIVRRAVEKGSTVLFLAPRRELIFQTAEKLDLLGIRHGIIMAGVPSDPTALVQVASVDTLKARVLRSKRMRAPKADVVIVDECHLSVAPGFRRLLDEYPNAVKIGLTATPCRSDGKPLKGLYQRIVFTRSVRELTDEGFLVPTRYFAPSAPDLEGIRVVRGDYDEKQLQARMDTPQLVGDVVSNWLRICSDRKTVVFATGIKHSRHLCERFRAAGIKAGHIDGDMSTDERDEVLDQLKRGEIQVICNCAVLTFGWDQPDVSCVILARPTKSLVLYFQTVGRVLRPSPGKRDAIVIDHAGAVEDLGFIDEEIPWTLDGDERVQDAHAKRKKRKPKPITCGDCCTVYEGQRNCPNCGTEPPVSQRVVEFIDSDLEEVAKDGRNPRRWPMERKVEWFAGLKFIANEKGYSEGWAAHKYREKLGVWPNDPRLKSCAPQRPSQELRAWVLSRQIAFAKTKQRDKGVSRQTLEAMRRAVA